ncbi:TetR/AcrR family transcriptional regulator [Aquamicrobium defluvii]|uniref:TetR/AcrR family transcriptional regulator n=1 Tax=Aquamicrobium defluvii TaxID=69279 RepID=UPI00044E4CB9|nr:TetR/AcrR family transcriptional regulator [Aquamicrobium defluvii]EZQ13369.1 hypothetical protein CF98_28320 [Halopseudomonas bauzanensis]
MKIERENENRRIDRRVARTRASLQDALIALVPVQGYASITVEDICARADVGRSTFYAHYPDKEALRAATIEAHLHSLTRPHEPPPEDVPHGCLFAFSRPMFEHAQAARALHAALFADGGDTMHNEVRDRIRRSIREELSGRPVLATAIPAEFIVHFVAGAFVSVLGWWLAEGREISAAEADGMFQELARSGLAPQ